MSEAIKESYVIEVRARDGSWVEVERIDLPEGCNHAYPVNTP